MDSFVQYILGYKMRGIMYVTLTLLIEETGSVGSTIKNYRGKA